ncbi:MAG: porin family protein [Gammaproteobacteria bacterium]|nr:porin family protein [Gammaproteobacteria bacterium]
MSMAKILLPAAFSLALLAPGIAAADEHKGFYAGISANWLDADFKDVNDLSFSDSDTTWGIRGGYMFNKWFGVEAGYIDLGDYTGGSGVTIDANTWQLAAVGNWDVTKQFGLYGKVGAFFVNSKSDQVLSIIGPVRDDQDDTEAYLAIGADYYFGKLGVFGEFSWVDTSVNDLRIDILTVGLKYNFGG